MRKRNLMAVVMEAAQMGRADGDFEKAEADGSHDALQLITIAADRLRSRLLP